MQKKITICVAGKNDIAINVMSFLQKKNSQANLVAIITKNDTGLNGFFKSFLWYVEQQNIPVITLEEVYKIPDLIFLSVQFDKIIKPQLFVSKHLFNLHFSLLPAYKGMYPSAWPILNNEKFSGVTLHVLDRGIDTGDIIAQYKFKLDKNETVNSLYKKYMLYGAKLMKQKIPLLIKKNYTARPQPAEGSTYYAGNSINYKNLIINVRVTAQQLDAQIRAFASRQYQMPVVHNYKIHHTVITKTKSTAGAGKLIMDDECYLIINTIDYNIILIKDVFNNFILACRNNDLSTIKNLIKYVDLEEQTLEGWTPLMIAAYNGAEDAMKYLLKQKANVHAVNFKGTSVLMYAKDGALKTGSNKLLDIILKARPDVAHKDMHNKNIFDYLAAQSPTLIAYISKKIK